jgi:type II secretory ATPase GspE/PulE/Tfp pilus assembly ATPase PilB-like protein
MYYGMNHHHLSACLLGKQHSRLIERICTKEGEEEKEEEDENGKCFACRHQPAGAGTG